ncbi:PAS domain S-box protein [Xanthocytophaga agilis]|uniref:histidine kinase n=1 Tax=Xanthocytophaga agilis TaxID=3048010 RepID=A0AAE3UCF3_9BACT|nr:PAS domain S-box protein [Xanthocytophaga agilis]MDJ1499291.1 PAS domain S-box protein [Xanthocytophaga agilis]
MEGLFKILFESAPEATLVVTTLGEIMLANNQVERLFGYTKEELIGREIEILLPVEMVGMHKLHRLEYVKSPGLREMGSGRELAACHKNGSELLVEVSLSPLQLENDVLIAVAVRDVTERRKLNTQLKISEQQFKGAFEYSAVGMALVSLGGKWMRVNKSLCQLLGYTEEEFLLTDFQQLTHAEDLEGDLLLVEKIIKGEIDSYQLEKRYFHKNGNIIWALLNVSLVKDIQGTPLHFISQIQDITEWKRSEQLLLERDALLSKLSAQVPGAIFQYQLFPDGTSSFPFTSQGVLDIYELTSEELKKKGSLVRERLHPDDYARTIASIQESFQTLSLWLQEYRVLLPKKGIRWIQGNAKPERQRDGSVLWHGYLTDITERKKTELALIESEQRWQFALEGSGDGVWDWHIPSGQVFYSNRWKSMLGYEANEIGDQREEWTTRIHPQDRLPHDRELNKYLSGEVDVYINEYRIRRKDGTYQWILSRGKVILYDEKGKPVRMIGTLSDISWQKNKETELTQALNIVNEQNKRLLNFAYIVSHNLRSHTVNLEMMLIFLEDENMQDEREQTIGYLNRISKSLSETVGHLVEVVDIQSNPNQPRQHLNLRDYIQKTVSSLTKDININKVKIVNNVSPLVSVDYNPAYLENILLNFISNGIRYRHPEREPIISLDVFYENEKLLLKIGDNGIGIDLEGNGRELFGMYKTFHGNPDAKGIGLFITKNQVEAMGGKIEVESKVDAGTTFKIYFR